jgi:hypothetical protein
MPVQLNTPGKRDLDYPATGRARFWHTATCYPRQVLVAGGYNDGSLSGRNSMFRRREMEQHRQPAPHVPCYGTCALRQGARGGRNHDGSPLDSVGCMIRRTGRWATTAACSPHASSHGHAAALRQGVGGGRVVVAGPRAARKTIDAATELDSGRQHGRRTLRSHGDATASARCWWREEKIAVVR